MSPDVELGAPVDVSVIIPCLNEAPTIGDVVRRAHAALSHTPYTFEVVVADNGSTDGSADAARDAGARVVDASARPGVGAATCAGVAASHGRLLVFLDADGEHDPGEMGTLLEAVVENGESLILGSRYRGRFLQGASSLPNRVIGTPGLTWLINHYYGTKITDCNTGFRALPRTVFDRIGIQTPGFEFCSEMIARAALLEIVVAEVPITQHPDREGRQPHLRRLSDGWRHLRFILLHAPDRVLLRPGAVSLALGLLLFVPQALGKFQLGPISIDLHLMILGALLLIIGVEMVGSAILCATIAGDPVAPAQRVSRRLGRYFHLDRMLPFAGALFLLGLAGDVAVVVISAQQGWQGITEPRLALIGTMGMGLAVQLFVLSFVHSVIDEHRPRNLGR